MEAKMKHAREDYMRIQDPEKKIPDDEPVFLIRAQDRASGPTVRAWADINESIGGDIELSRLAREHAKLMDDWKPKKKADS
jgi:hypothetical protein